MGTSPFSSSSSIIKCGSLVNLVSFIWLFSLFTQHGVVVFADSDKSVLLQLKNSVSDSSGLLSTWNLINSNHCSWIGVVCDVNSRVVSIIVTGNGKGNQNRYSCSDSDSASFPVYGLGIRRNCSSSNGILVGKLLPVIGKLTELRVLSFPFNGFNGEIPAEIWGMENLQVLDLEGNLVSGSLPVSFSGLRNLKALNLGFNMIEGDIPSSLSYCVDLEVINLSSNQLGGTFPGAIGDSCEKLQYLDLSNNLLVGGIPKSLGNCTNLRTLLLYGNSFEDVIPTEFGYLQKLQVLDLSMNTLSGEIPSELGNCSDLSILVLSNVLRLYPDSKDDFNFFHGTLPLKITTLPKLKILWAPRSTLEGTLPSDWGKCKNLEIINLADNIFSGVIPYGLNKCKKLRVLDLSSNSLTGELSEEIPVPCMSVFNVNGNSLSGSIPSYHYSSCSHMNDYMINANSLSSAYISFFTNGVEAQSRLLYGDVVIVHNFGGNNFTGSIPSLPISPIRLGKQRSYAFVAGENTLTGKFPSSLFEKCEGLYSMIVNISNNRISGEIPMDIGSMCKSLILLDASGNQIGGRIPTSFGELSRLRLLSLSNNNLTGPIPFSLGQLDQLQYLDLSSNFLSAEIPEVLVNLANLTVLLLNDNKLFGRIPLGLANVKTLSSFNVSYNNLSGPLPSSDNLMQCTSFLGNPYLLPCPSVSLAVPSAESRSEVASPPNPTQGNGSTNFNSIEIASIASASAIVTVLLALIVLFIYTKKWNPKSKVMGSARKEVILFTDIGVPLTFDIVVRSTGNFNTSNCIGNGGFGSTYKAEISHGVNVAIKRLSIGRFQGIQQFDAEIKTLGSLRHPNLVTLIGYHACESEMFLVYNYLSGGNLEKFIELRSTRAVDWKILHKIALDIAGALAYLHDHCVPRVLHRDVKPSNILLDEDFNAYLSDFGLARLLGTSETHATTGVAGTFGYVAPEYAMTCRVSDKADVYSYGVVLLELLSDKKAVDPSFSSYGNGFNIVQWAHMLLRQGRAKEFFNVGLWDAGPHDDLVEVLHLAVVCTVDVLSTRPAMKHVVRRLKQLQPPSC